MYSHADHMYNYTPDSYGKHLETVCIMMHSLMYVDMVSIITNQGILITGVACIINITPGNISPPPLESLH